MGSPSSSEDSPDSSDNLDSSVEWVDNSKGARYIGMKWLWSVIPKGEQYIGKYPSTRSLRTIVRNLETGSISRFILMESLSTIAEVSFFLVGNEIWIGEPICIACGYTTISFYF